MLSRLATLSSRRPIPVAAAWWTVVAVLSVIGLGVGNRLHQANITAAGSPSVAALDVDQRAFGDRTPVAVMLEGPPGAIDAQGPAVTRALSRVPYVTVFGPWSGANARTLRPRPDRAVLYAMIHRPFEAAARYTSPAVRDAVSRAARPPVQTHVLGSADSSHAIFKQSLKAAERAQLIAAPLLLIVLMIVLGSPVAASIPLVVGMSVVGCVTGTLELLNHITPLHITALSLGSMIALALGVDYSLLMVARFLREQRAGATMEEAAATTLATAGRTVRFAGFVLAAAMVTGLFFTPSGFLLSGVVGILVAVTFSLIAAHTVLPASLVYWSPHLDKWRMFQGAAASWRWGHTAFALIRRPAVAAALVIGAMLVLAVPALGLTTGPPDPRDLPSDSAANKDFKAFEHAFPGAWGVPYQVTAVSHKGPLTDRRHLAQLARFERTLRQEPRALAAIGPGQIASRTAALSTVPAQLTSAKKQLGSGVDGVNRLENGLGLAGSGGDQLARGLRTAAAAASQLAAGGDRARGGAEALQAGVRQAGDGARKLNAGLAQATTGMRTLDRGARRAKSGSKTLTSGLGQSASGLRGGLPRVDELERKLSEGSVSLNRLRDPAQIAEQQLKETLDALRAMPVTSQLDPNYKKAYTAAATALGAVSGRNPETGAPVQDGYSGLDAALAQASSQTRDAAGGVQAMSSQLHELAGALDRLHHGSQRLTTGIRSLEGGIGRLTSGGSRLQHGAGSLVAGIDRLQSGTSSLAGGLQQLASGQSRLSGGLDTARLRGDELAVGIGKLHSGTQEFATKTRSLGGGVGQLDQLASLFGSGYTVLAALDTATPQQRNAAGFAINVDRGGNAAQFLVVEKGTAIPTDPHDPLRKRLVDRAAQLSHESGMEVAVGGPAATLQDFDGGLRNAYLPYFIAVALVSYLVLVPILRSVVLPAIAVGLTLLTIAVALGVLVLTFQTSSALGGGGFVNDIMVAAIYNIVFALSIDYQVFLLARVREGYDRFGNTDAALRYALEHTAGVITGAAGIMTAVFFAFALSAVTSLRQLGIGLTVAVVLDATVVRLVLLPACLRLTARWNWWLPRPLERMLPDIEADHEAATASLGAVRA